jgi:predicted ester cyclase
MEETKIEMMAVGATGMEAPHKEVVGRFIDEAYNQGKLKVMDELLAADYAAHEADGSTSDLEATKAFATAIRAAFPNLKITSQAIVAEGDWVAVFYSARGTFTGELKFPDGSSVPPNNGAVGLPLAIFFHFNEEGKIAADWESRNNLAFLQQLGVIPMTEATAQPGG